MPVILILYLPVEVHIQTDASNRINGKNDVQILDLTFQIFVNSMLKTPLVLHSTSQE